MNKMGRGKQTLFSGYSNISSMDAVALGEFEPVLSKSGTGATMIYGII